MRKTSLSLVALATILTAGAWMARTQTPQASTAPLTIEKVKDNLYAIIGDGGNVAVYVTDEGVIVIDDKFERDYAEIMAKIKSVTDEPVKYVLNTHQHGDHTGGNARMLAGSVEIIAQQNARANMVTGKMPGVPRISFTDQTSVFLGGKEVRARYFGRGHTNGDAVIYFPDAKVVHTGDLFVEGAPLIDYSAQGSAVDWPNTLQGVLGSGWDFDVVIPGHGKVSTPAGLRNFRNKFQNMTDRVSGMVREGKSKDDVAKALSAEFGWPATRSPEALMAELKK
jgi:glyoxylase-like metal-dependent hydrolase (beta-lactamase superfamily II)